MNRNELYEYVGLNGWSLLHIGKRSISDLSRIGLIHLLEDILTRYRSDVISLSKPKLAVIDSCLQTAYLYLDGELDDVPLRFACASKAILNITADLFLCYLNNLPLQNAASWGCTLNESLVQRFLCYWSGLDWWEMVIGNGVGVLLIPRGGNDDLRRHYFQLPDWISLIEEAIRCSEQPLTVMELSAIVSSLES